MAEVRGMTSGLRADSDPHLARFVAKLAKIIA